MILKTCFIWLALLIMSSANQCTGTSEKTILSKIQFDYSTIDDQGLDRGEVAIDYEFCVPADSSHLQEVMKIAPDVRLLRSSHGRIGCSNQQWLCINSSHSPTWKKQLYGIASLPYIARIKQTFYE